MWFENIFAVYNKNLFKRRFQAFRVSGLAEMEKINRGLPLLIYANHSSWWDGLAAFEISRLAALDAFIMMEEKHLKKLFLFRRLGAFSIVRENPRRAMESIRYAVEILTKNPARSLWIFPQGEILPNDARPIVFYNGLSRIIEKLRRVQTVPIAFRYEFLNDFKPEVFVKIGKVELIVPDEKFDSRKMTVNFAENLTVLLDELKTDIAGKNFSNYTQII